MIFHSVWFHSASRVWFVHVVSLIMVSSLVLKPISHNSSPWSHNFHSSYHCYATTTWSIGLSKVHVSFFMSQLWMLGLSLCKPFLISNSDHISQKFNPFQVTYSCIKSIHFHSIGKFYSFSSIKYSLHTKNARKCHNTLQKLIFGSFNSVSRLMTRSKTFESE